VYTASKKKEFQSYNIVIITSLRTMK
jgi:hypothetical protein